jgi:hypothetical protein
LFFQFPGQKRANEIYKEALKRAQDEPAATPIVTGPVALVAFNN